jgi:LmbE family N-acetylglucosaminyl deacetylase
MKLKLETAEIFVPDGLPAEEALKRTTHMAIGAHADDVEMMAVDGVLKCFQQKERWFTAVIITDGSGSPRNNLYKNYTDAEMQAVRRKEQKKAALLGEYGALVLLDYPSAAVKDPFNQDTVADLASLFKLAEPQIVYTHNPADRHDTHLSVALRVITAIRQLPSHQRPNELYGCEVWRGLDWLTDADKVCFDVSAHENLQAALLGVFDSQVCSGKRYDLAAMGRRRANATFNASQETDTATAINFAMDLTPLVENPSLDISAFVQEYIQHFAREVTERVGKFQ